MDRYEFLPIMIPILLVFGFLWWLGEDRLPKRVFNGLGVFIFNAPFTLAALFTERYIAAIALAAFGIWIYHQVKDDNTPI